MKIEEGNLIPGVRIGDFAIGMTKEEVINKIGMDFKERTIGDGGSVLSLQNAKIWINKEGIVRQIGVSKGFRGSYKECIKIGTTLNEIKNAFGEFEYVEYTYNIRGIKGICFELEELEEWDELTAPIEWIFIYKID